MPPSTRPMRELVSYFKANPQVFVLVVICVVLGLGTFLIVVFALATSGQGNTNGEPSGVIAPALALAAAVWPA